MGDGAVLVYGLSRSGRAAVELLERLGRPFFVHDDSDEALASFLDSGSAERRALPGGPAEASAAGVTTAIMSPGIPPTAPGPTALAAAGIECISEIQFAFDVCGAKTVFITGTNGKSSTATMVHHLLEARGLRAALVGNIGVPFSSEVRTDSPLDWYVVEVSSYQLALSPRATPDVMVYTNYAPDHLSWHGSEEAYVEAKAAIARRMAADEGFVVYPVNAGPLTAALADCGGTAITLGPGGSAADVTLDTRTGRAVLSPGVTMALDEVLRDLPYSWRLVSCALHGTLGVARAIGAEPDEVVRALQAFRPLEHRLEEAGTVSRVRFINDSKATNVDATQYAVAMCPGPIILVLGGRDKGVSYAELLPFFKNKVKAVVALGEAREKIVADLGGHVPVIGVDGFEPALERALEEALRVTLPAEGSLPTVLFSPACSSFDMFANFEERGRAFKRWVREQVGA